MVKTLLRFVAGLAILAVGIFVMQGLIGMKTEPPVKVRPVVARPVKAMEVGLTANRPETPIEGRVDAMYRMSLFAEVNGVLAIGGKEFREGASFAAGEVLLRMEDSEPRAALVAQRSAFLQSLSMILADIQTDFPASAGAWMQYATGLNVEEPLPDLPEPVSSRERLFLANKGILSAFYNIQSAEERLSKYQVRAPFTGVLTEALVQPGGLVRAGQPMGTFVGDGTFEVRSAVHSRYLKVVSPGDSVAFVDERGAVAAIGQVARVASNVDPSTQSASVFCQIQSNATATLRDGLYLSGTVFSEEISDSFELDLALVSPESNVYVIVDEGDSSVLRKREVEVLFRSQEQAIVAGLQDVDLLLSAPISGAYDGMPVNIVE